MEKNNRRVRHFFLVLYCTVNELQLILLKYSCRIHHCVFIVHDKCHYLSDLTDKDGNIVHRKGELEKKHIHLLISFYNTHTFSSVKKLFTTKEDNPRVEPVNDMVKCFEYLTHKNDPEKYQYLDSDLVFFCDKPFYDDLLLKGDKVDNDNKALAIVKDILRGVNPIVMIDRYGRDYAIHMRQYKEVADEVLSWQVNHPTKESGERWEKELEQMGMF